MNPEKDIHPLIQPAKYFQDRFKVGLQFEGKDGDQWLWRGGEREWKYLDWVEEGVTDEELHESIMHDIYE